MLGIPTALPHPVEHGYAEFHQASIVIAVTRFVQDEPGHLDGVARVEQTTIEVVKDLTRGRNVLQHRAVFGFAKIPLDLVDTVIYPSRILLSSTTVPHDLGQVHTHHQWTECLAWPCQGITLGIHNARFEENVSKRVEQLATAQGPIFAPRGLRAGGIGHARKSLRIGVAPLA